MMDYLKDYNITEEEIDNLDQVLDDIDLLLYEPEKIIEILDMFKEIGVKNFYDLIVCGYSMFYDTVSSIKTRIDNYEDSNKLASLINKDAHNLVLADLI